MAIEGLQELSAIAWDRPWLTPWRELGEVAAHAALCAQAPDPVLHALNTACVKAPVRFVPQGDLPVGQAYEAFIRTTAQVPTRNNAHDFFNGLAWLHFPRIKTRLNQLQAEQIERIGVASQRGPVRDALTVFDENAAFLHAPPSVWQALESRDWQRLFVGLRDQWPQCQLTLFGHALLEKLITPRKPIVAHIYRCDLPLACWGDRTALDAHISADLNAETLATKPFLPLPVLGVPGWWADNEAAEFYADTAVFRPPRAGAA